MLLVLPASERVMNNFLFLTKAQISRECPWNTLIIDLSGSSWMCPVVTKGEYLCVIVLDVG